MWRKFIIWSFANLELTPHERHLCTGLLLTKLDALPLRDIISTSDAGEILINGSPLDIDKARALREAAIQALSNKAIALAEERVMWTAVKGGLQRGLKPEEMTFYQAAIWWGQQLRIHLALLSGQQENQEPSLSMDY